MFTVVCLFLFPQGYLMMLFRTETLSVEGRTTGELEWTWKEAVVA
jgi:hypothetical protein